jgi:transposase
VRRNHIALTHAQQLELTSLVSREGLPRALAFRARVILELSKGTSFFDIKQRLGTTAPTISHWKRRFLASGVGGLVTHHPGRVPTVLTAELRARILEAIESQLNTESKPWSCRKLAGAVGVSKDTVRRALKRSKLIECTE